jgi:imidazole glycerol-phosphate synthase subunit HisF
MLKTRVVAVLTLSDGVLFRTKEFQPDYRYTCNFIDTWSIDEIVLLDITRPQQGQRENFLATLEHFAEHTFVPLSAGGKVETLKDFELLLSRGADKIVVGTGALQNPQLIEEAALKYGSQCVIVSLDAQRSEPLGYYEVYGRQATWATGRRAQEWAQEVEKLGAGELLVGRIELDGSLEGYDLDLLQLVSSHVTIPIMAVGGAGNWAHMESVLLLEGVNAACTTCIYHFTEKSIASAKKFLLAKGLEVR